MKTLQQIKTELSNFTFNDYLRHLQIVEGNGAAPGQKPLRIAVLRSYTVETIEPVLKLRLLLEGYRPEFFFGDYNQFVQEVLNPSSGLYPFRPDVVLILARIEELLPDFVDDFGNKPYTEWESAVRRGVDQLSVLAETIERRLSAPLIIQNMTPPRDLYWGIYDAQNPEGQSLLVHHFNRALTETLKSRKSAFIWDFNRFLQSKGYENVYDPKMWYLSKNPFKQSIYPQLADDLLRTLFSALGKGKKCVVLDLDNTLWGGVAGEDGLEGIRLGGDYPGNCYRDFQKELLKLYHRGVILAVNSKNNEEDALHIIDNHPDMVLRRKHFAAVQINWNDKADNLKALARSLNIGLDSMIFIDDSPAECERIRRECPECEVICLPEKPYLIPRVLNASLGIENIRLTEEDQKKGEMYRAQAVREQFQKGFDNLDDFLKSLEIEVQIEAATHFSIPRIAQLTQKTNQMNLTTRRYTEANIQAFVDDPNTFVFSVSSKDRFGDNGIIGVFIIKVSGEECVIDTFLLSCRVIGRGIERSMIAFIADFSGKRGAKRLSGEFIPTSKNRPAADLYERLRFEKISETGFRADLRSQSFESPPFIRLTAQTP